MLGIRVSLEPPDHLPMLPFPRLLSGAPVRLSQAAAGEMRVVRDADSLVHRLRPATPLL